MNKDEDKARLRRTLRRGKQDGSWNPDNNILDFMNSFLDGEDCHLNKPMARNAEVFSS